MVSVLSRRVVVLLVSIGLGAAGCGPARVLSPEGEQVEAMEKSMPVGAVDLGEVGVVSGRGCGGGGEEGSRQAAVDLLRNEAARRGGDIVQVQSVVAGEGSACSEWRATGRVFSSKPRGRTIVENQGGSFALKGNTPVQNRPPKASVPVGPAALAATGGGLPPPTGPAPYHLGFDRPVEGCLQGQVYEVDRNNPALDANYATRSPRARLWGCEWDMQDAPLEQAIPHARAEQAFVVRYQGTFSAPEGGVFNFQVGTSSQVRLVIDGAVVTEDVDPQHSSAVATSGAAKGVRRAERAVFLGEGKHSILIEYLAAGTNVSLNIGIQAPGAAEPAPLSMRPTSPLYAAQGLDYTGAARSKGWQKLVDVGDSQLTLSGRIFFATNSAELNREDKSETSLLALAQALREQANIGCVEIRGHTDDKGDPARNLHLSQERAEVVRQWLVDAGIEPHRLASRGYGGTAPIANNTTEEGRAQNRRVEFAKKALGANGSCQGAEAAKVVRKRHAEPAAVSAACAKSSQVRGQLVSELGPWLSAHRQCHTDDDCVQAVPLECPGKHRSLGCGWVLVNETSVEALRVHGARLDSVHGFCAGLPEDDLVRSCGGCSQQVPACKAGTCEL